LLNTPVSTTKAKSGTPKIQGGAVVPQQRSSRRTTSQKPGSGPRLVAGR